jgi:very-short-patch-repair endonuclease
VLKAYLTYAEAGGQPVPDSIGGPADSDFEVEVRERLQRRGYTVDTQVGVSGYRIDLGVRNPDKPAVYLAGIECDGASYHSSKSARDRDRLRQDCLTAKGWEILRVWSTDWFDDPDGQTDKLARQLEELRQQAAERFRQAEMQQEARRSRYPSLPVPEEEGEHPEAGPPGFSEHGGARPEHAAGPAAGDCDRTQPAEAPRSDTPIPEPRAAEAPVASPSHPLFVVARVAGCGIDPNPDRFYEADYRPALRRMVGHVIDTEGPIYGSDLVTRIARAHGFQRNGGRIEERVLAAVAEETPATAEDDGKFVYWPLGTVPAPVIPFRRAGLNVRGLASIPLAELAGLAREFLAPGCDHAAVIERMREQFELGKLREPTRRRFTAAIRIASAHSG